MHTTTKQAARRATLPVWGMVGVALLVSAVVLGVFARPVIRAEHLLAEISSLREASRTVDNEFGRYAQAVNRDLQGAGGQDPDCGKGLGAATVPPDLRPMVALVAGEQASVLAEKATAAHALFDQMRQTLDAENRSSIALARHTKTLQEQQAAFTSAMLRLRSQIAQAEGRARLAAARAKAGAEGAAPRVSLQPLLVEAMDLALQVKDLEAAEDTDAINNAINNQLEPSLARITDLAAELAKSDEKAAALAGTVQSIVTALKGEAGSTGILAAYGERRRLDTEANAIQSQGAQQLDQVRQLQEGLRELADTRTATVRAALRESLGAALWSAGIASAIGVLALTGLAHVLAGRARRQVTNLAEAMHAQQQSRTLAEAALRESEALRRTIDEQSIVSIADPRGRIIDVNEALCRISGYTREELLGQDHRVLNSGHHPKAFWIEVWKTIAGGKPWRGEVCNKAKDGTLYWVDSIIAPFTGTDGKIEKYVSIQTDITARKRAESAMAASKQRLRTIIDAEPECVKIVGPGDVLLDMNPAGLAMLEAESVTQVRELSLAHFVLPKYHADFAALHAGVFRGEPGRLVFEIEGLRGTRRWLDAHAVPLRNAAGEVEAVLAVTRDVSEQKKAEAKAREAETFLRHTIDSLSAHTVVIGGDGRIRAANRAWAEFAAANGGAGPDALEGGNYLALCDRAAAEAEAAAQVAAAIRAVLAGDAAPATIEYPCDAPNEKLWFMCSIRGFSLKDERFAVISHLNITAIKLAELELTRANESLAKAHAEVEQRVEQRTAQLAEATEAAQAASKAKSEFLATMSHEIRTPLNGVVGTLELLNSSGLSERQQRYIQIGKTAAQSLTSVINDILDFSKIEAGKLELSPVEFDVRNTIGDLMEMLAVRASEKGLEMACSIDAALPEIVRGDPDRLRQIVINLVNNAIKFTDRGTIALRVTPAGDATGLNDRVRFAVTDTGIGIPKDRLDRLFKAFSQADASFSRKYGGTGLGLAICKQLAELMGGCVGVESEVGKGSTFWFEAVLPAGRAPEQAAPTKAPVDCRGIRLLVVEDHDVQRVVIAECLASLHFPVETAAHGEAALEMMLDAHAAGKPFAAVLTDHDMPGMDGIEVAVAMKSRPELAQIPVILLSSALDIDPAHVRAAGFAAHLTKPLRQSTLLDAVMSAVSPKVGAITRFHSPQPAAPADPPGPPAPISTAPRLRVLLAEDNEINQLIACELLSKSGFDCTVAANGRMAVEAVLKDSYDLVLMDCQMPEMDGFEAAREIRKLEQAGTLTVQRGRRLPIIALTANALKGDRERCLEAGMDAYSTKPIDLKHLTTTIDSLMSAQMSARQAA
jgi:two-component system sensor histidine kinase/response regulator